MLAYLLVGMKNCWYLTHALSLLIAGIHQTLCARQLTLSLGVYQTGALLHASPLPLLPDIGDGIISGMCCPTDALGNPNVQIIVLDEITAKTEA